jgi:hypothetical protein
MALVFAPGASSAAQLDTVNAQDVGAPGFVILSVTAQSGPSGENPSGQVSIHLGGGLGPTISGPVTCLNVMGNTAILNFQGTKTVFGMTGPVGIQTVAVVDNGPGKNTIGFSGFGSQRAPTDCSPLTNPELSGTLEFGGITIFDAPPVNPTSTSVTCSPSTFAPGDATACTATVMDTASSGQSTPTGRVGFASSGAGGFLGSPCTLSGSGASASCAVLFSSFPRDGQAITASYGGDATQGTSTGITLVAVEVPASTDGCLVLGHGRVTAANHDRTSFRGLAVASPARGAEFYRDNGPANPIRVVSTSVDAVTCTSDSSRASVFGRARVNGAGSVEYRIDIQLAASEWGKDTYRIRLSSGYDSGVQPIRHGDLEIRLRDSSSPRRQRGPESKRPTRR